MNIYIERQTERENVCACVCEKVTVCVLLLVYMLLLFGFVYSYLVCFGSTVLFAVPIKLPLIVIES